MIKGKGIYLMADGAQAPGMISVNVKNAGVDAYAASGHKWILGPKETGFLYLKKEFQEKVRPVFSFSGYNSYSKSSGTRNVATIIGLGAALDWHKKIGVDVVAAHCLEHKKYTQDKLRQMAGIRIISPADDSLSAGMVSFIVDKTTNTLVYEALNKKGITVKVLPAHNAIRISCHVFVSKSDIDKFIVALKPLVS